MALVTFSNLGKSFGAQDIFAGISASIPHRARIALVGPNGVGKTTLLNLIVGLDKPSAGSVQRARGLRMGYLPQRPELAGEHTLWEEMLRVFAPLREMEAQLAELERQMAAPEADGAVLERYGALQRRYEEAGGFEYEHRIRVVLTGLGFTEEEYSRPLPKLSGGERTRALLGRLLLEDPDLLVLDEPTNHLDIDAVEWLEGFLKSYRGAVLAVSHDRTFMDRAIDTIWEMAFGGLEVYRGNYSHYVQQREARHERQRREYEAQQAFIQKEMDYIRRNMAGQNTNQAKGRLRRLQRLMGGSTRLDAGSQGAGLVARPREQQRIRVRLEAAMRSGDKVLMTHGLAVGYPDGETLFAVPDITLYRGEIAALIGPNGAGKTTLLKTLLGRLPPKAGRVRLGAGVQVGYFAQAHEELDPQKALLDEILGVREMPISEARHYLATFLFRGDDVFRPISTLSGGERGRVALAKLALSGANFLLLDEPTNHLDIPSQEILQRVLEDFNGTILMVSHDRYLIDALATQVWAVRPGEMMVFEGPYREYVAARQGQASTMPLITATAGADERGEARQEEAGPQAEQGGERQTRLSAYQRARQAAALEKRIDGLEVRLVELSGEIGEASTAGDAERVRELGEQYARAEAELEAALAEWEALHVEEG